MKEYLVYWLYIDKDTDFVFKDLIATFICSHMAEVFIENYRNFTKLRGFEIKELNKETNETKSIKVYEPVLK